MYRIMLVDDEENILRALKRVLNTEGDYEIEMFTNAKLAIQRARETKFHLILSDYRMPEMDGVSFLAEVKMMQPQAIRLILSGYSDLDALLGAINRAEIFRFISKPWEDYELKQIIAQALKHQTVIEENQQLADLVRTQQIKLNQQTILLNKLEEETPGITQVNWADDGSIILDEE